MLCAASQIYMIFTDCRYLEVYNGGIFLSFKVFSNSGFSKTPTLRFTQTGAFIAAVSFEPNFQNGQQLQS